MGRAPRTKETLPDFLKWRQVTRHPLVFRGLTGSQRTPGFGASQTITSHAYDFHTSFHSCQYIIQAYINIHMQHVIICSSNDTHTIKPCNGHCTYQFITFHYIEVLILTSKQVTTLSSSDTLTIKPCHSHLHI